MIYVEQQISRILKCNAGDERLQTLGSIQELTSADNGALWVDDVLAFYKKELSFK